MRELISVIVPNYNYGRFLTTTIDSVLSQTWGNVELIVIDNGSTDDSREILDGYRGKITVIYQDNLGQAVARNAGLVQAKGSLFALLDADDYWEPTKLEKQMELISEDVQLVYTGMRQFDNETGMTLRTIIPTFRGNCQLSFLEYPTLAIVPGGESSVLLTRKLVDKVGIFDPSLSTAAGRDYYRRCSEFTKFDFVGEVLLNQRMHGGNMSTNSKRIMADTAKAYEQLFADPRWEFAIPKMRSCMSKLYWSFIKTNLKTFDLFSATKNLGKLILGH